MRKEILNRIVKEQTERLIEYAKKEIQRIGNDISVASTRNNLDRTGNLLDSLCWGVTYSGQLKGYGFYRQGSAAENSALHEWSRPQGESVYGHGKAEVFISEFDGKNNGWNVFFAVTAPYWGYWEKGFYLVKGGSTLQWAVMTHHFDVVRGDLSPAEVSFNVYVPTY